MASEESVQKTVAGLAERGIEAIVVDDKAAALAKIKELIPEGATVMNGSSTTLQEIGYTEYVKSGEIKFKDLHAAITTEVDPVRRAGLRKQAITADFYLGSVHALTEDGQFVVASGSGNQLPHIVFTSPNLILVAGTQKIVPTLAEAMKRLEKYVIPLEDKRMRDKGGKGTKANKVVIFKGEPAYSGRKVRMVLVKEKLGF